MELAGWNRHKISDYCKVIRGASPRPKGDKRFYGGSVPRLMVEDVTRDGKYVTPIVDSLTELGATMSRPMRAGSLTVVCSGTVGIPAFLEVDACIHDGFLGLTSFKENVSREFVYYQLEALKKRIDDAATHGGVFTNLTVDGFSNFEIDIPASLSEQQAIAEALSDADALIASLEKLIEKKRHLFNSLFNQLLSEKQNYFNETGSWQEYTFDEAYHFLPTATNSRSDLEESGVGKSYIHYGDIHTKYGMHLDCSNEEIPSLKADLKVSATELQVGDLVMADASEDLAGIGMAAEITGLQENKAIISGLHTYLLREKEQIFEPRFQGYFFNSEAVKSKYLKVYTGMKVYGVSKAALKQLSFKVPNSVTQSKIVEVLDPFNQEIECLKQRLNKTKKVKAGMMQELLTGRTRLT